MARLSLSSAERQLAEFLRDRLKGCADEIVSEWVQWIRARMVNPAVESLSLKGLLNHIPPVIDSLGNYVLNPTYAVREEMLGHLRMHGQIRRDQGYDLRDVMAELDGLSHLVMRRMQAEVVESGSEVPIDAALTLFGRLSGGMRAMAFVALSVYRETEDDRRQELARRLAEFGRTIGHELRSPLNSISLSAEVLRNAELCADDERRRQQIDVIQSSVKHAEALLYDVDLLAMAESAHTVSRMSPLPTVMEAVREELLARAKAMDVTLDFGSDVPRLAVETVVAQLALTNLVTNSIKYADPDKDGRWVRVRTQAHEGEDSVFVELTVSDNGLGIPDELKSRVFQRRFRAHPERAEGTGLGLAITRELVMERGGSVELESEEGRGTTLRVRLRALDVDSIEAYTRAETARGLMHTAVRELLESEAAASDPAEDAPSEDPGRDARRDAGDDV